MTRVLVWKELREQGLVLTALLALGSALLVTVAVLAESAEAGRATELRSLTTIGALGLIALVPTIAIAFFQGSQSNFPFGGTSILIIVGVGLETVKQIESQLQQRNYEGFLR